MSKKLLLAVSCLLISFRPTSDDEKLDFPATMADETVLPVFVRMKDQLFRKAGDYELFSEVHRKDKRSKLRPWVLKELRSKADSSFKEIKKTVEKLEKDGEIKSLQRYWIVNGFAARATVAACKQLASFDGVEFIYRSPRGVPAQHKTPVRGTRAGDALTKRLLDEWKDDSDEPLNVDELEIPWNLKSIQADLAWTEGKVTGKGVVIALNDGGMIAAPALTAALWRNKKEKLNGKDDDGNGYIDDIFGYNFSTNHGFALNAANHGTICGGIMSGRPINKRKLITGIAPRSRLMILTGMGQLRSLEYALANGADVISMSYMFIRSPLGNFRGVFRLAHEHLAAGGVVSVGGSGNFANNPRTKQIAIPKDIPAVICAGGVLKNGQKFRWGSEGPCVWDNVKFYSDYPRGKALSKPDVTGHPTGYPMWQRPVNRNRGSTRDVLKVTDAYGLVTGPGGNSFSGPHAGGVAALMLEANPDLNVWEVKEIMEQTCKDIGAKGRDPVFGHGLMQALEAVKAAKNVETE